MDRRDFLRLGAGAAIGLAATGARTEARAPLIRRYVRLGRTEMRISDISFGSSSSADPELVRHALARGINYFDTAESYRWGNSEEAIGEALKGKRDQVFLATKTKAGSGDTHADMMKALEGSLRRLRTDHVDVYFNHAVNDVTRLSNPEWREFTERAKRQGKIRFRGMSGHGGRLVECLDYALDHDLADVVLVAYNFSQDPTFTDKLRHTFHWSAIQPELPRVLEKAKRKDVGVIAMKTLMGARLNDMRPYEYGGATFAQAAFRWTLSSRHVDALVISMTGKSEIDEFVAASGDTGLRQGDRELLRRYAELQSGTYCRPACNRCEESCPAGVQIAEVLRARMYLEDYRDPVLARAEYAQLGEGASACLTCVRRPCLDACPAGVPIARFTRDAAVKLS
ncbi:MAG TPA: aldo/keto reductase [Burkholderiales bacterium]|jgi:predicted aldo/keto reductase-like oxidoreductase|nr:aldo/keto reductase [Burkholderiales bacterium]